MKKKTFKKTDKYIKYTYQKKNLLEKIALKKKKIPAYLLHSNDKAQYLIEESSEKTLCFLDQGLKSKEIVQLRIALSRLGIQLNKVPLRLWSKIKWDNTFNKTLKKNFYGNLLLLSKKQAFLDYPQGQQFQENYWIQYIYNQNLNFLNFQNNTRSNRQLTSKDKNNKGSRFVESPFNIADSENNIGLLSKNVFLKNSSKNKKNWISKNTQIIYPWDTISSDASKLEFPLKTDYDSIQNLSNINIEDISKKDYPNFSQNFDLSAMQKKQAHEAENNKPETNAVNHVKNWNDLEGHPLNSLMHYVSTSQFHFIGMLTKNAQEKNCNIVFPNHNIYDWISEKKSTKKIGLSTWSNSYADDKIIEMSYLKVSPLSCLFLCQL